MSRIGPVMMRDPPSCRPPRHATRGGLVAGLGALAIALPTLGCQPAGPPPPRRADPATAPKAADGTRLVVLVVIDQMPAWSFDKRRSFFHAGLARLIREGVYYEAARYPYASTVTAAGHAALVTGAPPRVTGIVGNSWFDRESGHEVESADDAASPMLPIASSGQAPAKQDQGGSPKQLLVDAVGDALRASTHEKGLVASVSYKKHPAVLMGGHHPNVAVWYDPSQAAFSTSRYYSDATPRWLDLLAREHPVRAHFDAVWTPLAVTPKASGIADDAPGEYGYGGLGATFPHRLRDAKSPAHAIGVTPLCNDIILEAAIAAIDGLKLGADAVPDFLAVSFSGHDLAAHAWGQDSWEAVDILLHIDEDVGKLLEALDTRLGSNGYALVLAADHGAPPTPEQARDPQGLRIDLADVTAAANGAARDVAGAGSWIASASEWSIYLSEAARALAPDVKNRMLDGVVRAVAAIPGIAYATRTDQFEDASCDALGEPMSLVCRSVNAKRSGDIYYGPRPHALVMHKPYTALNHGTTNLYDRTVPLIVRVPGHAPLRITDQNPSTLRVAPTLARLLGVPAPSAAKEPPL